VLQLAGGGFVFRQFQIIIRHQLHEAIESDSWFPAELAAGFGWIAQEQIDFGRTEIARIDLDVLFPVEIEIAERRKPDAGASLSRADPDRDDRCDPC
jgi:hypothetical protein